MIYESTIDNIQALMRSVERLEMAQVLRFFRDVDDIDNLEFYIKNLIHKHILDYDDINEILSLRKAPKIHATVQKERITAFWIIADFASSNIRDICLTEAPSQFLFITHSEEVYDLTVCTKRTHGQLAMRSRMAYLPKGAIDDVNHIAIVQNEKQGEILAPYEFDSFCILSDDKVPVYYEWN